MLEGGEKRMNEKEQEILGRYAHWQSVIRNHGLRPPSTIDEFLEVAGCDGQGGCVVDVCSGGNGEGCFADSCSAGSGDNKVKEVHRAYIVKLREQRHRAHLGPVQK